MLSKFEVTKAAVLLWEVGGFGPVTITRGDWDRSGFQLLGLDDGSNDATLDPCDILIAIVVPIDGGCVSHPTVMSSPTSQAADIASWVTC